MAIWCIIEMIIIFAHILAAMIFLFLRFLSYEAMHISNKKFNSATGTDFIDAVGLLFGYFKAIVTPCAATVTIVVIFNVTDLIPEEQKEPL